MQDDSQILSLKKEIAFKETLIDRLEQERERATVEYVLEMDASNVANAAAQEKLDAVTREYHSQMETLRQERDRTAEQASRMMRDDKELRDQVCLDLLQGDV